MTPYNSDSTSLKEPNVRAMAGSANLFALLNGEVKDGSQDIARVAAAVKEENTTSEGAGWSEEETAISGSWSAKRISSSEASCAVVELVLPLILIRSQIVVRK